MTDNIDTYIETLSSNDESNVRRAAEKLGELGDKRAIPFLIETIKKTKSNWVRNVLAGALRNLDAKDALQTLTKLALEVGDKNSGSLIYAMQICDCREVLDSVAALICTNNFEQRELAFQIIEDMQGIVKKAKKERALSIVNKYLAESNSIDAKKYLESAIQLIIQMPDE